jgi:hypothetical protein
MQIARFLSKFGIPRQVFVKSFAVICPVEVKRLKCETNHSPPSCDYFNLQLLLRAIWAFFFLPWRNSPTRARAASFLRFPDHTHWHTTVGGTPLDEGSAVYRPLPDIHTTLTTDRHALGGVQTRSTSKRSAADPRLRPLGHWDWLSGYNREVIIRKIRGWLKQGDEWRSTANGWWLGSKCALC